MQRHHIRAGHERGAIDCGIAIGTGLGDGLLAPEHLHLHAKGTTVARHQPADLAVAPDAQGTAMQAATKGGLPVSLTHALHIRRQTTQPGQDEKPGQLGGGMRTTARLRHQDAACSASGDVDMRAGSAGLRHQLQLGQPRQQGCAQACALANQHHRLGLAQALDQRILIGGSVVVDMHGVTVELAERRQAAHCILIVIKYDDAHTLSCP